MDLFFWGLPPSKFWDCDLFTRKCGEEITPAQPGKTVTREPSAYKYYEHTCILYVKPLIWYWFDRKAGVRAPPLYSLSEFLGLSG
jgi:hypothetical protein